MYLHVNICWVNTEPRIFLVPLGLNMRSAGDANDIPILDNLEEVADQQILQEPIPEPNPVIEPEPVQPAPVPEVHDVNELLEIGNAEGKDNIYSVSFIFLGSTKMIFSPIFYCF